MKKNLLLAILCLLASSTYLSAQPYYLRGEASPCDWGNSSAACQLQDPDADGIFEITINFGASAIGRKEFKIYNAGSDSWHPGSANSWFNHQGGTVKFRFNPANNQVEAIESTPFSICAPGEFSGWNNAAPMVNAGGGQWCYTVPTAGTYQWKPTYCGAWDSWQPSNGERSVNSNNWSVTTTSNNQQFCVTYDANTGRVVPPAPPTGYYLKGTAGPCDWNNLSPGCELKDPDGDGVYELTVNYGTSPIGRQEFKIYHAATDTWYPSGGNSWYYHQGGSVTFRFFSTTGEVRAIDGFTPSICAPGQFSGWNNTTAMEDKGYGIWCYKVPSPGTYEWKPVVCGTFDSWQPTGGSRNVGSDNWTVTTTAPNEEICVTYTLATGKVAAGAITAVPTMTEWGLFILCLLMLNAGIVTLRQRQLSLAGAQNAPFSLRQLPMDRTIFIRCLLLTAGAFALLFAAAVAFGGYEMTSADVPGSLLSMPLIAYLAMLLYGGNKSES